MRRETFRKLLVMQEDILLITKETILEWDDMLKVIVDNLCIVVLCLDVWILNSEFQNYVVFCCSNQSASKITLVGTVYWSPDDNLKADFPFRNFAFKQTVWSVFIKLSLSFMAQNNLTNPSWQKNCNIQNKSEKRLSELSPFSCVNPQSAAHRRATGQTNREYMYIMYGSIMRVSFHCICSIKHSVSITCSSATIEKSISWNSSRLVSLATGSVPV